MPEGLHHQGEPEGRTACALLTPNTVNFHRRHGPQELSLKCLVACFQVHMGTHMWSNGASRRGRRMSLDLPPIPMTPKDSEFLQRRPDLFYPYLPAPFLNGMQQKVTTTACDFFHKDFHDVSSNTLVLLIHRLTPNFIKFNNTLIPGFSFQRSRRNRFKSFPLINIIFSWRQYQYILRGLISFQCFKWLISKRLNCFWGIIFGVFWFHPRKLTTEFSSYTSKINSWYIHKFW